MQELIDSLKRADGEFSINQLTYKRDIMTVDSAFLVNHIEWAFKVWREQLGESMLTLILSANIYCLIE